MIYAYNCNACGSNFVVNKPMAQASEPAYCDCGEVGSKQFFAPQIIGAKVEDNYWSHALGKVVPSKAQERAKAKELGYIEVGNEDPKKYMKPKPTAFPTVDELYKKGAFDGLS